MKIFEVCVHYGVAATCLNVAAPTEADAFRLSGWANKFSIRSRWSRDVDPSIDSITHPGICGMKPTIAHIPPAELDRLRAAFEDIELSEARFQNGELVNTAP